MRWVRLNKINLGAKILIADLFLAGEGPDTGYFVRFIIVPNFRKKIRNVIGIDAVRFEMTGGQVGAFFQ